MAASICIDQVSRQLLSWERLQLSVSVRSLEASSLTCLRGGRLVFRDLGFSVSAGKALSLEGPNGAGKTSLLRMIAGFLAPAAGTILLRGEGGDVTDNEERGKFIGWLGHHDAAKPQLSPRETLTFFCKLTGVTGAIEEALENVGLARAGDLPCQYLSAGQKKRLALARLKLSNRPIWLLDEPLAALDADGKVLAADLVKAHCATGGIVIAATHEPLGVEAARLQLT
jgi:heme exporter protein A